MEGGVRGNWLESAKVLTMRMLKEAKDKTVGRAHPCIMDILAHYCPVISGCINNRLRFPSFLFCLSITKTSMKPGFREKYSVANLKGFA